jgi:hypothetical protein
MRTIPRSRFTLAVVGSLLVVALVALSSLPASASRSAGKRHQPDQAVLVLKSNDEGKSFTVTPGTLITATLHRKGMEFTEPGSSAPTVVEQTGGSATKGNGHGSFTALTQGTATISATATPRCGKTGGCSELILEWSVTINVS